MLIMVGATLAFVMHGIMHVNSSLMFNAVSYSTYGIFILHRPFPIETVLKSQCHTPFPSCFFDS